MCLRDAPGFQHPGSHARPRCDRSTLCRPSVTGPGLPPSSYPCYYHQGDRSARAPAPPAPPAPPSQRGRHLHPTSAFAAAASDATRLASPLPRARRWHPRLFHLPRPVCRHHPSPCLHCRDHPHTSPPPCIATSIPTLASGGYRGHRFCTVTTPFAPPLPRRPRFHGHHPLHPSHCHGVDSCRPCNRHEHVAPEVTAASQHGA